MKWLLSIVLLLVLAIGGAIIAPNFMDWNQYKGQAVAQVKSLTGLDVVVDGDISLALIPTPRVYLEGVKVTNSSVSGEAFASFKQLDVNLGFGALLKGEVEVSSVHLDGPDVRLVQGADGAFNYMTPEIKAMMDKGEGQTQSKGTSKTMAVSFDEISINEGRLSYKASGAQPILVENADLALRVESLSGPFIGDASFKYNGQDAKVVFKTGLVDMEDLSTRLNLDGSLGGVSLQYAGVVNGGEDPSAQGEFGAKLPATGGVGEVALKGFVSANSKQAALKDSVIELAGQKLIGSVDLGFSPMSAKGVFSIGEVLDLDQVLPKQGGSANKGFSVQSITAMLPKTIELPVFGAVDIKLSVPGFKYQGQRYGASTISVTKAEKSFKANVAVGEVPGAGRLQANLALSFAEKSYSSQNKMDIYSGPSVDAHVKGEANNFPVFVKALSGQSGLPLVEGSKRGVFDVKGHVSASGLYLDKAVVNIDEAAYSATGSLKAQDGSAKDLLKVTVNAGSVDADAFMGGSKGSSSAGGGDMPFDVDADISVNALKMQWQSIKGLDVGVLLQGRKIVINKFSAADLAGNKIDINSNITVDMGGAKPKLSGSLALGDLRWRAQKTTAQKTGGEKWSSAPLDVSWLNTFDMDFDVSARSIDYEGWVLSKPSIDMVLQDGILNVSSLQAGLFDGSINGQGKVQPLAGGGASLGGQFGISNVNMEPLVKAFAGERIVKGSGRINMKNDISGAGASMKAIIGALKGQGTITGSKIVLDGIDVQRFVRALSDESKPGDTVMNLWKGAGTGGSTEFDTLDGSYVIQGGMVNIQKLLLDGPRAAIDTTGQVNLPAWTITTAHKMSVKDRDDVPPFTVNISGPLDNPASTFAQGAINDYLQRKIQRKLQKVIGDSDIGEKLDKKLGLDGVLQGVLGGGSGSGAQQQQPTPDAANDNEPAAGQNGSSGSQELRPEDAVKDLIKGLF